MYVASSSIPPGAYVEKAAKRQLDQEPIQECVTRKKQKPSDVLEQNTGVINDVIAIAGIHLEEEEQMLLSGGGRIRAPSQEEGTTILQKSSLQRKLEKIMARCGIESKTKDVEHCLSLCVEERLHGLISKLIKMSKQKRSLLLFPSKVQHYALVSNQKLWKKESMWDKGSEGEVAANVDMNKDMNCAEPSQIPGTANTAARAFVGWDESEWKKHKTSVHSQHYMSTETDNVYLQTSARSGIPQESPGKGTENGQHQEHFLMHEKISVEDIIALLEREPLMSNSTLNYCLYNLHERETRKKMFLQ
ncbi:Transcription initiation factor TFIID subunit 4b [Forsythia ovata]|uniref:Transcription initiation factor TFIID subunit 4b n=1 Tax=Forsythia ovata TaxID=205694 RepID=A0ABD1QMA7_9LAMI